MHLAAAKKSMSRLSPFGGTAIAHSGGGLAMLHTFKTAIFISLGLLPCITGCNSENPNADSSASSSTMARHAAEAEKPAVQPEIVARFDGPMPTGVAVSKAGRIFVTFPRWGDPV